MLSINLVVIFSLLAILFDRQIEAAKILGVFSVPSYSHQVVFQPIWKELAKRGHEMVILTPNILENNPYKNLRQVSLKFGYEKLHKNLDLSNVNPKPWRVQYAEQMEVLTDIDGAELAYEEVQNVLKNETSFDLVIVQWMTPTMIAFGAKFGCPIVAVTSLNAYNIMYDAFGNPTNSILHPEYMTGLDGQLTFWERLESSAFALWQRWHYHKTVVPRSDSYARKYLGQNLPSIEDITKNISMIFLNVNPLIVKPRPNLPNVVEFTGMHIREHQPLPADIKDFLDKSQNGVIYMSLGTNVKSSSLPLHLREMIVQVLSELPYNVLWKYEADSLQNKPKNVMTKKWIPQQDVLGHKNVKLFIMQGGAQSLEEAIHNQVPIVGIPVFSDQPRNIRTAAKLGFGLGVDTKTVTKEEFKKTILEVIENKKYKETIIKLSQLVKDQPMSSLDKVVWWIEYVIRHKGAYHLRSPYADIPWWKNYCVDVILFLVVSITTLTYFALKMAKYLTKLFTDRITIKIKSQ